MHKRGYKTHKKLIKGEGQLDKIASDSAIAEFITISLPNNDISNESDMKKFQLQSKFWCQVSLQRTGLREIVWLGI